MYSPNFAQLFSALLLTVPVSANAIPNNKEIASAFDSLTITNLGDVRGNIFLPSKLLEQEVEIVWTSDKPKVITSDGVVSRRSSSTNVKLTASINHQGLKRKRSFTAKVREASKLQPYEGYAFSYFTGDSLQGENIFFASSIGNNALQWRELNGGKAVLTSSLGTKGLRDPFLIRSPEGDTFYLIATDLSIGSGTSWDASQRTGSRYLEVWESHDLKSWSAQRHVLVSPSTAGNTWAPEAFYDEELGAYVVFWASKLYAESDPDHTAGTYQRMLYVTTRDFVTFSTPEIWQDGLTSRIDSTVIRSADTYYRFTKDEGATGSGCTDIIQERSTSLRATLSSWTTVDTCIGRKAGTKAVEGPTAFKSNEGDANGDKFYLFVDEYGGRGYIPLETTDIGAPNWTVPNSFVLPASPRHGTVIPVTAAELAGLQAAFP